jgi:putative ABC transport system ATP-binding protein
MIELTDVAKVFNRGEANEFSPVRGVTLTVLAGEALVLKGPSGSGKTSLLALMGCMSRPSSGRIRISGPVTAEVFGTDPEEAVDVSALPERFMTLVRRRLYGFVFQQFNLVRGISARENVMLPLYPTGRERAAIRERADALLTEFGIGHRAGTRVELLSGGEQQRVAIARALANEPAVVIADEPTAHLDTALSGEFLQMAARLRERGTTLVIASHDPLVCNAPFADRVLEMRDGCLLGTETAP